MTVTALRWPGWTLRNRLVVAFGALVTLAVLLVGGVSYFATEHTLDLEIDRSLASAAAALAAGGTVTAGDDTNPVRPADRREPDGVVAAARRINADGTVTPLLGRLSWPVSDADRTLAASSAAAQGSYGSAATSGPDLRVYTLSLGNAAGAVQVARDLEEADRILGRVALLTLFIGGVVIVLSAGVGWWLARHITRRLVGLAQAADTVATTGDLAVSIDARGRDEVGRLGGALRTMLSQLGQARDAQQRLVENAGHELRTPLTSLRANARVLRRYHELPAAAKGRLLDDVDSELVELTNLVNELVELATDRRDEEQLAEVDLKVLAERVADRAGRRTGRSIHVTGPITPAVVRPHALARAITNLVDNAVKFGADGDGPIEVVVDGGVEVRDRGPGLAEHDRDKVFDRFFRSDTARSRPGSGLGLAIVRDIAKQHGGAVYARPRPGGGAVIGFTLALAEPPPLGSADSNTDRARR